MSNAALAARRSELLLGRFRALRELGAGGSGSVWLTRDEQTGQNVVLKIVAREGKAGSRAEREASAAGQLRHPNCLRALARARDATNVYIAYEYVPGKTLRDAMRTGELDDERAIETVAQICDGLAHAHDHGIVHRDVKPANVLLADGDDVSVRILDFGLAQLADAETLTLAGDVPGTLAYISPERLAGHDAETAADVWAVGVLLWEALAGRHPFWAPSLPECARKIQAGAPSLRHVRPDLPRALTDLVDRTLSLEPGKRPSAARLAWSLRRAGAGTASRHRFALPPLAKRLAPAALTGVLAGWSAAALPLRRSCRGWASRSRWPRPSCPSATYPRASRCSTAQGPSRGWRSRGAIRAAGSCSRSARCSRRRRRSGSCRPQRSRRVERSPAAFAPPAQCSQPPRSPVSAASTTSASTVPRA
jgi:serine/threonine protein kinase